MSKFCYAERLFPRPYPGRDFTDVRTHPERLEQPLHWKRPRKIFVNSMSDLFHEKIPVAFIKDVFGIMALAKHHTFQVLTKRPKRMQELMGNLAGLGVKHGGVEPGFGDWPLPNLWLGVSCEDQATADKRIPILLQTPAAIRFVSYEPALGPVDFRLIRATPSNEGGSYYRGSALHGFVGENEDGTPFVAHKLSWVICGGESGPHARPMHPQWARDVRDQCMSASVKFFMKQWGEWLPVAQPRMKVIPDETILIKPDGSFGPATWGEVCGLIGEEMWTIQRVGKKAAGHLLDGKEWSEFP